MLLIQKRPNYIQKPLRFISWLAFPVVKTISYLRTIMSGRKARVRALIMQNDHILLVRNNGDYHEWTLPGGGIEKKELPNIAIARELAEELRVDGDGEYFKSLSVFYTAKAKDIGEFSDRIVYQIDASKAFLGMTTIKPNIELFDAAWFPLDTLPVKTSKLVHTTLQNL